MHIVSVVHLVFSNILGNSETALYLLFCMAYVYMKDSDFVKHNLAFVVWWEHTAYSLVAYEGICCELFMCDRGDDNNFEPCSYHMVKAARE